LQEPDAAKESRAGGVSAVWQIGQPVATPHRYDTFAAEAYERNIVAYRCIALIAESAASVPWLLYDGDREVESHWLLDILRRPNPSQDWVGFAEALYSYDLLAGNQYTEANFVGRTGELYTLRPDRMKVLPGADGLPSGYRYEAGGRKVEWRADEWMGRSPILHVKRFSPLNDWYGQSPLAAAGYSVDQHNAASRWNLALLQNGMRPSGALQYEPKEGPGELPDDQFRRLKAELDSQGPGKAGRPMLLDGGLKWVQTMLSQRDSDWLGAIDKTASQIAQAYNVPEQLVGVPGQQTYNNYREARLALYEDAVLPLVNSYVRAFTEWLAVPLLGSRWRFSYNDDDIPALAPRKEQQFDRLNGASFLTTNEKRAALGYEPVPGGDELMVPAGNLPLSFAAEPPEFGPAMTPDEAADAATGGR
jgi:HK97 family phage portal protein